jgi:thiamine-monophosphate kinase
MGGDTVSTPGPFMASLTILGWVPAGRMIRRAGARPGDVVLVSGSVGDGGLGLRAANGEFADADRAWLADRYRLPQPRLGLGPALRKFAHAAADVSDGLIADAGRIATASGVGMAIDLDRIPLSAPATRWLQIQPDRALALRDLATAGDDYEIVCTTPANAGASLADAARSHGVGLTEIGVVTEAPGVAATCGGVPVTIDRPGYRHR